MALHKRGSTPLKMPFPGESPTVSLAMAAGQMYGLHDEEEMPPKANPAKASKKKAAAKPARKAATARKATSATKTKPKSRAKSR